jgi:hypothetical protein
MPKTINLGESLGYVFIGIKSRDNASGTAKDHFMKVLYAPISKYNYMEKNRHLFNGLFNGMYNKVVILHDPTKPAAKEAGTKSTGLSPTVKGRVKTMFKDGIPTEEIAKDLDVDLALVVAHIMKISK